MNFYITTLVLILYLHKITLRIYDFNLCVIVYIAKERFGFRWYFSTFSGTSWATLYQPNNHCRL